ncbi:FecR family protein [Bradyrhizobium sp. LjRoot220]|uniref:FecR family protein n=1 Tax=Bradyrhizobium sp. LjRoot220 TaxID=3342284 RepID=UPI003ECE08B9
MRTAHHISRLLTATFFLAAASSAIAADDGAWTVSKSSGEVWRTHSGAQPASLQPEEFLKPGDTIRTGKNGRVLLKRGEESMMIAPNSVVGVPAEKKEGLSTTIVQQAGSILLDVEKRNVRHFEVETPYLAAVVKGTQFRVTVNATSTSVDVIRGQVEVADFRTGQIAQVKPGQHATSFAHGKGGLSLGGSGTLSPIESGKPRTPSIERVPVPRAGLTAPRNTAIGQAIQSPGNGARASADKAADKTSNKASHRAVAGMAKHGGIRISSAIGEVKVNVHKVTNGLARDKSAVHAGNRNAANKNTIWGSSGTATNSAASTGNAGNVAATSAGAASAGTSAASSQSSAVAAITGSGNGGGNGNGNGNSGNGNNGSGNGNNGANGNGHNNNRYGDKHTNGNGNGGGNGGGSGHGKNR